MMRKHSEIIDAKEPMAMPSPSPKGGHPPDAPGRVGTDAPTVAPYGCDIGIPSAATVADLRASEQRFRDCAAAGAVWFWEMGPDLRFTWFSDNADSLCGLERTYMLGKSRRELGLPEDSDVDWPGHMADLAARRPVRNFRYRARRPDDAIAWLSISGVPFYSFEGSFLGYRGTACNVTAEVLAERRADQAQHRLHDAIESIADGFAIFDADDRLVMANSSYRQSLACVADLLEPGVPFRTVLETLVGRGHIAVPEEQRDRWLQEQLENCRTGPAVRAFQTDQGRWINVSEFRARDGGRVIIRSDQTQRVLAEIELRKLWCAVEQSSAAVIITDPRGSIEYVNPSFTAITGYNRDEVVGCNPRVLRSQTMSAAEYAVLWDTITSGNAWQGEFYNCRKDGSHYWGGATISPVKAPDGAITHFIGIQVDITQRKHAEQELKASEERFRSLVESALLGICIERDGKPVFVNQTFAEIFGYRTGAEIIAQGTTQPLFPETERARAIHLRDVRRTDADAPSQYEIRGVRKDGELIWLHAQTRSIPWQGGTAEQSTVVDITLRKVYEDRLHYQANYDAVTELPNRSLALDRANRALISACRRNRLVALLFIDVDHFKKINDTLGHAAGDRFLREMARRIGAALRREDTVARLGGDEFLVLLTEIANVGDARLVADRILEAVSQPFVLDGQEAFVTVSIGVATFPEDGDDVEALMRHADAAMYEAKEDGRNTLRFVTPELRERNRHRIRLEGELRHAIGRDQLILHYQPLVDIRTGRIIGAEALLRWNNPDYGDVGPDRVVRIAEETGLIVPIGEWVLATGCRELRRWIDAGHPGVGLSVNVSSRQFRSGSFADAVRHELERNALPPEALELEITESLLLEDLREVTSTLDRLVACGVHLAVDDFGTGYSSLSYLTRFPLDTLKIDRSFIGGLATDPGQATLVDALIALSHRLHLRVIAEGLETLPQLEFLRAHGCDLAQGYYFSRPIPADRFLALLDGWQPMVRRA